MDFFVGAALLPTNILDYVQLDRRFLEVDDEIDPEEAAQKSYREMSGGLTWDELYLSRIIVVLGEAGSGRTWEVRKQAERLEQCGCASFVVPLQELVTSNLQGALGDSRAPRFNTWLNTDDEGVFFLDAAEEAALKGVECLDRAFERMAEGIRTAARRVTIVLTCRVSEWRPASHTHWIQTRFGQLLRGEEGARENAREASDQAPRLRIVQIAGLDRARIETLARHRGITDLESFRAQLDHADAWIFARRPKDVESLVRIYLDEGSLGGITALIQGDIKFKLRDTNGRFDRMNYDRAFHGATFLAAASIMSRTISFALPDPAATVDRPAGTLAPLDCLTGDWTLDEARELFHRPLFDEATYGRVRFHHRDTSEFLAAEWFRGFPQCPAGRIEAQFWTLTHGRDALRRSRAPVAAWLATLPSPWGERLLRRLLATSPEALLVHGDADWLNPDAKQAAIAAIISKFGSRARARLPKTARRLGALAHPMGADYVSAQLRNRAICEDVRTLLVEMVRFGRLLECSASAFDIAVDPTEPVLLRESCIEALSVAGNSVQSRALADFFLATPVVPWELLVSSLTSLYPKVLRTSEVVSLIRRTSEPPYPEIEALSASVAELFARCMPWQDGPRLFRALTAICRRASREQVRRRRPRSFTQWASASMGAVILRLLHDGIPGSLLPAFIPILAERQAGGNLPLYDHRRTDEIGRAMRGRPTIRRAYLVHLLDESQVCDADGHPGSFLADRIAGFEEADLPEWLEVIAQHPVATVREHALVMAVRWATHRRYTTQESFKQLTEASKKLGLPKIAAALHPIRRKWRLFRFLVSREGIQHSRRAVGWYSRGLLRACAGHAWLFCERGNIRRGRHAEIIARILALPPSIPTREAFGAHHMAWAFEGAKSLWRQMPPSSEDDEFYSRIVAVAGIEAELRDGLAWNDVSHAEATAAIWCAVYAWHALPQWLDSLAIAYPQLVAEAMTKRFERAWDCHDAIEDRLELLQNGSEDCPEFVMVILPIIINNMRKNDPAYFGNLRRMLDILMATGRVGYSVVADLAPSRIALYAPGVRGPWMDWLIAWLGADAESALSYLAAQERTVDIHEVLVRVASLLRRFDGLSHFGPEPSLLGVQILPRLIRLCNAALAADNAERRPFEPRSDADNDLSWFRNAALQVLANGASSEVWAALCELRDDPALSQTRWLVEEHLDHRLAQDADAGAWVAEDVRHFAKRFEVPPKTGRDLHLMALLTLEQIRAEVETHHGSIRDYVRPGDLELRFEKFIAQQLKQRNGGHYIVARQSEYDTGEKPDICLSVPQLPKVWIELKLANERSGPDLIVDLRRQLLAQYLLGGKERHGIFVVGNYKGKEWQVDGRNQPFSVLIDRLKSEATKLREAHQDEIDNLDIVGIDFLA
jgi:hypothetical protein